MAKYIERETVLMCLTGSDLPNCKEELIALFNYRITNLPLAEVQPVKHGKWKKRMSTSDSIKCSVCGNNHGYETRYCPHCGARMDGDKE